MALTAAQRTSLITLGILGGIGYLAFQRREQIKTGLQSRGESLAQAFQRNPSDLVETSLLAYELGLRPSSFVAGFGGRSNEPAKDAWNPRLAWLWYRGVHSRQYL